MMDRYAHVIDHAGYRYAKRQGWYFLGLLPWLTLAVSLAIAGYLWLDARHDAEHALQTQFDYRVRDAVYSVAERMKTYEQVMRGVDGLFAHARVVSHKEFHDYIDRLQLKGSYPGINDIRFIPVVSHAMRSRHIAAARKDGLPAYTIWPEGRRDLYAPVVFVEPHDDPNHRLFGYDMFSDDIHPRPGDSGQGLRRAAMEQARDSGKAALSGKINLSLEAGKENRIGFMTLLPVYKHEAPHGTLAERRANIIGWIASTFRMRDLMNGILGEDPDIDIEIYDGESVSAKTAMYDANPLVQHQNPRFRKFQQITVANRTWTVGVHSLPDFDAQADTDKPRYIAVYGAGASLFFTLFVWLLVGERSRALQASQAIKQELIERQQAEKELRVSEERFRSMFDYSRVGMNLLGPDYSYLKVNRAFSEMTGYSEQELIAHNFKEITHKDDIEANLALSEKLMAGKIDFFNMEKRYIRKDGSILYGDLTVSALRDKDGKLMYCIAVVQDVTERKHMEMQLRELTAYLQSVREEEKSGIAREIHDDLGGMLTSLKIEAYWLKTELAANNRDKTLLLNHVREMSSLIDSATGMMRNIITGLRPTILDDLGLLAALEWQAARFNKLTGIRCRVNCIGDKGGLDRTRSIELFRIAQEALSNVARHSGATSLEIEYHHNDEEVVLSIIDNGRGMEEVHADNSKHYGILGMRERAEQLGGTISFDTPPGGGFSVTIVLPLADGMEREP